MPAGLSGGVAISRVLVANGSRVLALQVVVGQLVHVGGVGRGEDVGVGAVLDLADQVGGAAEHELDLTPSWESSKSSASCSKVALSEAAA